jgi:hypothetical protein
MMAVIKVMPGFEIRSGFTGHDDHINPDRPKTRMLSDQRQPITARFKTASVSSGRDPVVREALGEVLDQRSRLLATAAEVRLDVCECVSS